MIDNIFGNLRPVVKNILIINILIFIAQLTLPGQGISLERHFALYNPASEYFRPYQLVTYMFLHGSIEHLLFNMLSFVLMGNILEQYFGSKRFLNFYLITGIGAAVLYSLFNYLEYNQYISQLPAATLNSLHYENGVANFLSSQENQAHVKTIIDGSFGYLYTPSLGASGAIYAILTAFALLFPNVEMFIMFIPVPIKAKFLIPFALLMEVFLNFAQFPGDQIAHLAHLTGAFMGFLLIKYWRYKRNTFF